MDAEPRIAWVSGILEGEGAFLVSWKVSKSGQRYPTFRVSCNMCDGDVLQRLGEWSSCGRLREPLPVRNPAHRPVFRWNVNKRADVESLIRRVLPFMGCRRSKKIAELLEIMEQFPPRASWRHATRAGYDAGCRCEKCRAVNATRAMARRRRIGIQPRTQLRHGTRSKYVSGCRCEPCRVANMAYNRKRRAKSILVCTPQFP